MTASARPFHYAAGFQASDLPRTAPVLAELWRLMSMDRTGHRLSNGNALSARQDPKPRSREAPRDAWHCSGRDSAASC